MIINPYRFGSPPPPPPLGWWKFDDGSGAVAVDSSGNGYNLDCVGTYAWGGSGHIGGELILNGGADAERAISPVQSPPFTLAGWLDFSSGIAWSILSGNSGSWDGWYGGYGSGDYYINQVRQYNNFGTNATKAGSTGTYIHYAATVDASNNMQVYVNGVAGSVQGATQVPSAGNYQFCIGGSFRAGFVDNRLVGDVDDWRLYNSVLSAADIAALAAM